MGKRRGSYKGPKDFNTEMRLLINRLSRAVADKESEVEALAHEQRQLLLRVRASQLVMQAAEQLVAVAAALSSHRRAGERLPGIVGSQQLAQLQRQLGGMREDLARLKRSAAIDGGDEMRQSSDDEGSAGGSASGGGGGSSSGHASAARPGTAGGASDGTAAGSGSGLGAGGSGGAGADGLPTLPPHDAGDWMAELQPLCWSVEEAVAAVQEGTLTDHATNVSTYAAQMAPLLSHVNSGAPDEPAALARLDALRGSLLARTAATWLTTADSQVPSAIYASFVGPKNGFVGGHWDQYLDPAAAPPRHSVARAEPPPGHWRWLVEQLKLTHEQELMFEATVALYWERVTPLWEERERLLAALQGGPEAAAAALAARGAAAGAASLQAPDPGAAEELLMAEVEAVQRNLLLLQVVFGLAVNGALLTSWQVGTGLALAQPFVPSFLAVDQGLRELKAQRAERAANPAAAGGGGGGNGLRFRGA